MKEENVLQIIVLNFVVGKIFNKNILIFYLFIIKE